jgi:2-C-methyl-D-erythritol 4-phosphate cytidylyltransferase
VARLVTERHVLADDGSFGPVWAIVLAGGSGDRFGGRKQFAAAGSLRLVDLAVETALATCDRVVLVLPGGTSWDGTPVARVVPGGADRPASVRRALAVIPDEAGTVVVHQAANPLARPDLIRELIAAVAGGAPAVCPGLRPADVVRRVTGAAAGDVVGRDDLVLVQTPTAFRLDVLRHAHASGGAALEDTALVSASGYEVRVVPGDPRNVHVATPADLDIVRAIVAAAPARVATEPSGAGHGE